METEIISLSDEKRPAALLNLINIALDTYDDIFSDFDPSPYSSRILSDDFLKEVQRRYVETKKGGFEIRFSLPKALRSAKIEALIKKRLKDYFNDRLQEVNKELKERRKKGGIYILVGFIILGSQILLTTYTSDHTSIARFLEILLVPAGWYGMFVGIENLVEVPQRLEDQRKFYEKFRNATYYFISEEDVVKQIRESAAKAESEPVQEQKSEEKV